MCAMPRVFSKVGYPRWCSQTTEEGRKEGQGRGETLAGHRREVQLAVKKYELLYGCDPTYSSSTS